MAAIVRGSPTPAYSGWRARLDLLFAPVAGRTVAVRRRHDGPLRTQRSFHPEGIPCHSYLIHPPGGIVGGDQLNIDVAVENEGHAVITTPAASKFYRSAGPLAVQRHQLRVADEATLEWLPREQIVFDAARVDSLTRIDLSPRARFVGWELTCLGRPAAAEGFDRGTLRSRFELWRQGRPLLLERNRVDVGDHVLRAAWGLAGHRALATLVAVGARSEDRDAVRAALDADAVSGVTLMDDVLVVRWLGAGAESGLALLERAWAVLRPRLLDRPACPPRIWRT